MALLETKYNINLILSDSEIPKKLVKEINFCIENKITYMYVIGESEYFDNKVILKDLKNKTQELINFLEE